MLHTSGCFLDHTSKLAKQVRCNEHRKRSLNVTFFTFLRLGCDSKLMNESHKKVQVVVILNHGTKGPCPHTGDGDTGAQWPVVAIQRVWCGPGVMRVAMAAVQNSGWSPHYIALPSHCPHVISSLHRDHWPMVPTWPRLRWLAPGSELKLETLGCRLQLLSNWMRTGTRPRLIGVERIYANMWIK